MDIQLVAHAKEYIDDLAKGINPLTKEETNENDIVNQVKISRCLFFVSEVLGEVIANGGTAPKKRERPVPFSPDALDLEQFDFSDDPISLTEVSRRINDLKPENMQKIKVTSLSEWLVDLQLLETVVSGDKSRKRPTLRGFELGITEVERHTQNGSFKTVAYTRAAQRFILDNLSAIVEGGFNGSTKENAFARWTEQEDFLLTTMAQEGASIKAIATELKRSNGSVTARLDKLGIKREE